MLLPRKDADERDTPGADIRDVPEASSTLLEDWLYTYGASACSAEMEPGGATPVVPEKPRVLEAEATGVVGWDIGI